MDDISEEWKPDVGYETNYEVSDKGRVRRIGTGKGAVIGRILKYSVKPRGYLSIILTKEGRQTSHNLHKFVAEAFLGPRPAGLEINHKDGNKANCSLANLEYLTSSENKNHAFRNRLGWRVLTIITPS